MTQLQEDNKSVIRRLFEEGMVKGEPLENYCATSYVDHTANPVRKPGLEGFQEFTNSLRASLPDYHIIIEKIEADSDRVIAHTISSGTDENGLFGTVATGKKVRWTGKHTFRVEKGKAVEHWGESPLTVELYDDEAGWTPFSISDKRYQ